MPAAVKEKESKKIERYLVTFYDNVSGWLHSSEEVTGVVPGDVVKTAVANVLERTGEDLSRHRAAITDADTGHGVSTLDNAATKAQLQSRLDEIAAQLHNLEDDEEEGTEVSPELAPGANRGAVTQADIDAQIAANQDETRRTQRSGK